MVHVLFVILLITMKRKFDIKKGKKKLERNVIDKYIKIYVKQCFFTNTCLQIFTTPNRNVHKSCNNLVK